MKKEQKQKRISKRMKELRGKLRKKAKGGQLFFMIWLIPHTMRKTSRTFPGSWDIFQLSISTNAEVMRYRFHLPKNADIVNVPA